MKLELHPEAEQEFLDTISYYEAQVPGLGAQFDADIRRATSLLLEYPELGPVVDEPLRKLVLDRFPYYLIYAVSPRVVQIVAIAHERRRPGYWAQRIDR